MQKATGASTAIVGVLNLQVILAQQGDFWVAQGVEIDYAAGGTTLEDVQKRFEGGLGQTIQEHLRLYGHLDRFLVSAPSEAWLDLVKDQEHSRWRYTQLSVHNFVPPEAEGMLPFKGIEYVIAEQQKQVAGV